MIYLVNPSEQGILRDAGDRMPLGLLYIAQKTQDEVRVFDLNHSYMETLLFEQLRDNPELVGISCLTSPLLNTTKDLIERIKKKSKSRIVVGGYHPSVKPDDLRHYADSVLIGEGEEVIDRLGFNFIQIGKPANLDGLTPKRDLLNQTMYQIMMDGFRTTTIMTSRGCPNNCTFCGNLNRKVRYHSLDDVAKELDWAKANDYSAVYFLDDVFTINKERAKQIGKMCKERDLKFRATTRANYVDSDLVGSLQDSGLILLSLGVESGNPAILKGVGKNQTREQITEAVKTCQKYGVKTKGFFILGLPGDTEETIQQTIEFRKELGRLGMEYADFYPLVPFPGSQISRNPRMYGIEIDQTDYTKYLQAGTNKAEVVCHPVGISRQRLQEIVNGL